MSSKSNSRKSSHRRRDRPASERHPVPADQMDEITRNTHSTDHKRVKIDIHLITIHPEEQPAF